VNPENVQALHYLKEKHNFKRWLENSLYDELIPIYEREKFLHEPQYYHEKKAFIMATLVERLNGADQFLKFLEERTSK
jgi:hypothetical protein